MHVTRRGTGETRGLARAALMVGLSLFAATAAQAQVVIVGNAQGCFGLGCAPAEAHAIVLAGVPLTYTSLVPVDFSGITAGGQLAVNTDGTSTTGNFGSIAVGTSVPGVTISTPFTLLLMFLNPLTGPQTFEGIISGFVSVLGTGAILVDFDPAIGPANVNETTAFQPFFDPVSGLSGMLRTTVFGTPIPSGGTGEIAGLIEVTNIVPEPFSILLLGTGLLGLAGAASRRRKQDSFA